jgi:aminoglycoside phosphotransferase (APT) family kinase protein
VATEPPTSDANLTLIARAEAAVARLLNERVIDAEPIARGFVHDNIRVRLNGGREVVVKFPYNPRAERFERMRTMLARLRAAGVSGPEIVADDMAGQHGEPVMILSWLPGEALSDAWPSLTGDERQAIGRELGEWAARLHAVRFDDVTQGVLLRRDLDRRLGLAGASGLFTEPELAFAEQTIGAVAAARREIPAAAVHGDLYLDNVIIDGRPGSRRMAGVIDFERLMPEDPVREFVKFRWWIFETYPDLEAPLMAGYLAAGGEPDVMTPDSPRAFALELLETIAGVVYFTDRASSLHAHANDQPMADDMRRRFNLLVARRIAPE